MGKWSKEFRRQAGGFGREFKRQAGIFAFGKSHRPNRSKHHPKCLSTHRRYCGGKKR
jgi:hypothetical protein